jgi:hypothetical protein
MPNVLLLAVTLLVGLSLSPAATSASDQSSADALQPGTVWTGHTAGDPRKPKQDRERGARLHVSSRDGQKFQAELAVQGRATFALALEGRVNEKGQVAAKVTRIIRGAWPEGTTDDVWTGTLGGEQLVLKHTGKQNLVHTVSLALDPEATERQRRQRQR